MCWFPWPLWLLWTFGWVLIFGMDFWWQIWQILLGVVAPFSDFVKKVLFFVFVFRFNCIVRFKATFAIGFFGTMNSWILVTLVLSVMCASDDPSACEVVKEIKVDKGHSYISCEFSHFWQNDDDIVASWCVDASKLGEVKAEHLESRMKQIELIKEKGQ